MRRWKPKYLRAKTRDEYLFFRALAAWRKNRAAVNTCVCMVLLVTLFYIWGNLGRSAAWFSQNKEVSASGIQVSAEALEAIDPTVSRYYVTEENGIAGNTLHFTETQETEMLQYSLLDARTLYYLVQIDLGQELSGLMLTVSTETTYRMDRDHPLQAAAENNKLSSIVQFADCSAQVTETDSTCTVDISGLTWRHFDFSGNEAPNDLVVMDRGTADAVWLLLRYNESRITQVYSDNIGNEVLRGLVSSLPFGGDFIIHLTRG